MSHATRNALEVARKIAGLAEDQARGYAFAGEHGWDIDSLPIIKQKAYPGLRDPAELDLMMIHCTGVTDGFGVQKWGPTGHRVWGKRVDATQKLMLDADRNRYDVHPWTDWEKAGLLPYELTVQLGEDDMLRDEPADRVARFVALLSRYRNTPYHQIGTMGGHVVANRRLSQCTHHGNGGRHSGGNQGFSVAFDCGPRSDLTDFHLRTFSAAIRAAHLRWLKAKRRQALANGWYPATPFALRVVAHAQSKYPGRANDPGGGRADLWRLVVIPTIDAIQREGHRVIIDENWSWGTGRPLPKWGRRVA